MARTGTFLAPGVSKNKRRYTVQNIGKAVEHMNARLAGGIPIPMHTSHLANAEGDSRAIAANVTRVWQDPTTGKGRFGFDYVNTEAGQDIQKLTKKGPNGAPPALRTVSIYGGWVGEPTKDQDGVESADDLDVAAIDFTYRPGIGAAQLDEAALAALAPAGATIWESVDFDLVEESGELEDAPPSVLALLEAEMAHVFEDGFCRQCMAEMSEEAREAAAATKTPYGDVAYADNGFQKDGKKRYPVDTKAHVRSAWAYISKASNAAKYTAAQLKRVKAKIISAAKKFGINIAEEASQLTALLESLGSEFADVLEAYASTSLSNGQGDISVSAYTDEPADLPKVGLAVARAALAGLLNLDPDNDGDVDLGDGDAPPGDEDIECESCGADNVPADAMYCPTCGQPVPGAESAPAEQEGAEMADPKIYTVEEAKALLGPAKHSLLEEGKAEFTADEMIVLLAAATPAVETAPPVKEETELEKARRLVKEDDDRVANQPATVAQIAEMLKAERTAIKEELIEEQRRSGAPMRRGLVETAEEVAEADFERDAHKLAEMSSKELEIELEKGIGRLQRA